VGFSRMAGHSFIFWESKITRRYFYDINGFDRTNQTSGSVVGKISLCGKDGQWVLCNWKEKRFIKLKTK
jgi:hypothetical protein